MNSLTNREKIIILLLSSIPFIVLSYMVYVYSVDIPVRDDLNVALLLDKYYHGTLTWYDLFVQHNEHRLFFPYLIMIPTAILSEWNVCYWIAFNVIFGLGIFIVILLQVLSTSRLVDNYKILWSVPILSIIVFSLKQYENWLWGFQLIVFISVLFAIACIFILARSSLRPTSFALAMFFGVVGSFSFSNGMLIWPIGFLTLLLNKTEINFKKKYLIAWIIISAAVVLLYSYGYQKPSHHPSLFFAIKNPFAVLKFIFAYLGSPFTPTEGILAPFIGLSGVSIFIYVTFLLLRFGNTKTHIVLPYLSLSLYSILNAAIIAIGRAGWGWEQSLNSRYVTHAIFFWISLVVVLFILSNKFKRNQDQGKSKILSIGSLYAIIALTLLATSASFTSIPGFFDSYIVCMKKRSELLAIGDIDSLPAEKISDVYLRAIWFIKKHHMSVYREK
jgi:hypothetical protein